MADFRKREGLLAVYRRQVIALCHKNLKLFMRRPLVMAFRVFLAPLIVTLLVTLFKNIGSSIGYAGDWRKGGVSDLRPIKSIPEALMGHDDRKFVFARNGLGSEVDQIIDRFAVKAGANNVVRVDKPAEILEECRINLAGAGECFTSIIFNRANGTHVDYILAYTPSTFEGDTDWRSHKSSMQDVIWPVQFALDSAIADLPSNAIVNEQSFQEEYISYYSGYYNDLLSSQTKNASSGEVAKANTNGYYFFVSFLLAPFFFVIFIEMVFHVCGFLTRERESGVTELLNTQGCRQTPQIVSYFVSFWLLYLITWIVTGIIIGAVLFTSTNTGYLVLFQVLAGTATLCMCIFLSTLFTKGHFSGPVSAIITLALAMIIFNYLFREKPEVLQMTGLAAVFPPFTYASLIADIARLEGVASLGFRLSRSTGDIKILTDFPSIAPYLYIIFFLLQIPLYLGLAVGAHFSIWHVPYIVKPLASETGLAMRITGLSKRFRRSKSKEKAVDNLSLEIRHGQVVCLLGPNGGGKTTTLKCIGGVVKADHGSTIELGCDRTEVGYCPQHNVIWPQLTVREHVQIWLEVKAPRLPKAERDAAVEEMVRECDLSEKMDAQARTLSGGQKRKLQLAVAFIGGSKIVTIDEASSGVDPLSRQNIWQIIQQGVSQRTILLTTHFLDEADVLADHIVIMSKGKLVVEGSSAALKAQYGDGYSIYTDNTLTNKVSHAKTSAEASQKLQELVQSDLAGANKYEVSFPTIEQVFLKVANGEKLDEESEDSGSEEDSGAAGARENPAHQLDSGRPISKLRQIWVLFKKRYSVLPHNWLAVVVALAIPIAVTAACMKGASTNMLRRTGGLHNCQYNIDEFDKQTRDIREAAAASPIAASGALYYEFLDMPYSFRPYNYNQLVVGPQAFFRNGSEGQDIARQVFPVLVDNRSNPAHISSILFLSDSVENYTATLSDSSRRYDFGGAKLGGVFAPEGQDPRIAYGSEYIRDSLYHIIYGSGPLTIADNILSRRRNGPSMSTTIRQLRSPISSTDFLATPFALFLTMAVIAGFTAAIIYPTYERIQKTRSLQYSNGVSPVSLWSAYLLFELQLILVVAIIMLALLLSGDYTKMFYGLGYCFGAIILTGIATVLGCFVLSLYFSAKLAYMGAIIIHLVLLMLYFVGVILTAVYAPPLTRYDKHNQLAAGLGLTSPAANLARAFLLATNSYSFLCGKYGEVAQPANPFAYHLFGGVYFNLILQIVFLGLLLMALEYNVYSRVLYRFKRPSTPHTWDKMEMQLTPPSEFARKSAGASTEEDRLLECFGLHKSFNGTEAVHDVTLSVSSNETMALLGPNGAGKSTTINMIRGQLKPDVGDVLVRNKSVRSQLVEARAETGVCPQEDAVDDLTVFSTLKFYAEVRGVPNPAKNAEVVMAALGIQDFAGKRVSKLSGGTRRKLSVAIALLGNPPVLVLDEPSTGLDAVSKRTLWKTLKALGTDRATLLTTHSMEEVEALATSVSIIAVRLLASGTTSSLREEYGGIWHVRALVPNSAVDIRREIHAAFEGSVGNLVIHGGGGQVTFGVNKDSGEGMSFAKVMKTMEELKSQGKVGEYSLNGTTLQEVFLNVCGKEKERY
ncbi:hypothetical protein DRE_01289 [Drechslerella stenobrocha 248]|uniref:ABC transporter domain-containing protein n=1 Tax=Drechslerella stenobrocha 248 TaxID=1043628 RepID=W7HV45_9PEZI|nr:hypothetical protein DRE_01289 [Drechslerella stenobrocha 248]